MEYSEDRLIDFLHNRLSYAEREELEKEIQSNPEVNEALRTLRENHMAIAEWDAAQLDHIDSLLLAEYAAEPTLINSQIRARIEEHVKSCQHCREDLQIARQPLPSIDIDRTPHTESLLDRIRNWFLAQRLIIQPIAAAAIVLLVGLPIMYSIDSFSGGTSQKTIANIEPAGSRSLDVVNDIILSEGSEWVQFAFLVPVLDNRLYDVVLFNSRQNPVVTWHDLPPVDKFVLDIPMSILDGDMYRLVTYEKDDENIVVDSTWFNIRLRGE